MILTDQLLCGYSNTNIELLLRNLLVSADGSVGEYQCGKA